MRHIWMVEQKHPRKGWIRHSAHETRQKARDEARTQQAVWWPLQFHAIKYVPEEPGR